jgi:hypothetical protein
LFVLKIERGENTMENQYRKWFGEKRGRLAAGAFESKGWTSYFVDTKEEARELLFNTCLPKQVSVGLGGSDTLDVMDILSTLRNGEYKLHDRYNCADHFEVCRESLLADYFLTGANALTVSGEMVNIDCSGSRVAAMAYGPKHIIVVAGVNKICANLEEAARRAMSVAPMNCKRNNHKTPCVETGVCADCNSPSRMCNQLLFTLNAQKFKGKYTIIIVNEELGF